MQQFAASVNEFLAFRKFQILPDGRKGSISHEDAVKKAESEYDIFNLTQVTSSDFDKQLKSLQDGTLFMQTSKD